MIFIDEAAIMTMMCKKKAWFTRGHNHQLKLDAVGKSERFTVIGGVSRTGIEGLLILEEGCKKFTFLYFMNCLIKRQIEMGQDISKVVFVLDNCPIHHSIVFQNTIASSINVLYLSPYSPFLNPIELFWSNMKQKMFKAHHTTRQELIEACVRAAFSFQMKNFNNNYFKTFDFHASCMNLNQKIYQQA